MNIDGQSTKAESNKLPEINHDQPPPKGPMQAEDSKLGCDADDMQI